MSIKRIGLCGRSGSGKQYVGDMFGDYGIPSIDTDKVYRELLMPINGQMSPCLCEIVSVFGDSVVENGVLNRGKLAAIVFSHRKMLLKLNDITHKYIFEETEKRIAQYEKDGYKAVIIDAPVLFESGFDKICNILLCVTASDAACLRRILRRDGITEEKAMERLKNQYSVEDLRSKCDFEITNDGAEIIPQIEEFLKKFNLT